MKYSILILILYIGCYSCTSLDTEPEDFVTPNFSYKTLDEINAALIGIYDVLGDRLLYSGANGSLNTIFNVTDEMFGNSKTISSSPRAYNYSAADAWADNIWVRVYKGIERANIVIANIDKPDINESQRNQIMGEAKFMRAYFHFMAVQNFGAVPLRDHPTESVKDVYNRRVSADSVYNFIYNEMVEAEQLVEDIVDQNYAERVTKSAVQGILARVCLQWAGEPNNKPEKYADALFWAEKVINSGYHELNSDYSQVFINLIQDKYDTKESIWEIGYYTTGSGEIYTERGFLGTMLGIRQSLSAYGYSSPQYQIHEMLYNKFQEGDLRRDWSIAPYYFKNNKAPDKIYWDSSQIYNRYIGKWRRQYELIENRSYNGTNHSLLRYSDVLMMAAEAENEINGPTEKAFSYLNEVRRRAFGSGRSLKSISVINGGSGYNAETTMVTIVGGIDQAGIDPTTVSAVVDNGVVTAINIDTYGTLYPSTPVITIEDTSGGIGATAEAVLTVVDEFDLSTVDLASKEAFREEIMDERARELCFEGWRRLDLIRWGTLISKMKEVAAYVTETAPEAFKYTSVAGDNIEEKHIYFPISAWELSTNNVSYQNPGW